MRSHTTSYFWRALKPLPQSIRRQAREAFRLFEQNPFHPSLHFKHLDPVRGIWSVRVGIGYRALGIREADKITWFWIGSHSDYDKLA